MNVVAEDGAPEAPHSISSQPEGRLQPSRETQEQQDEAKDEGEQGKAPADIDELVRLRRALHNTTDETEQQRLYESILDLEFHRVGVVEKLHQRWLDERDLNLKQELGEALRESAVLWQDDSSIVARNLEIIVEVATNGQYSNKQIPVPTASPRAIALNELQSFEREPGKNEYGENYTYNWVIRRITPDRFEMWLPHRGLLFDGTGKTIATALPPRHDGHGREWYGAFLPDGRWPPLIYRKWTALCICLALMVENEKRFNLG
jgi:hypothetical protein